jgi:hypothetical protein
MIQIRHTHPSPLRVHLLTSFPRCRCGACFALLVLEVGNPGLSVPEARSHFALWCLIKSPLLIGCDLRAVNASYLEILTNAELIAISQDPLGIPGWLRNSTVGPDPAYRIPGIPQELTEVHMVRAPPPPPLLGPFGGMAVCELESSQGVSASQRWVVDPTAGACFHPAIY